MNINKAPTTSRQVSLFNYFTFSLDNINQFKAEIHGQRSEKHHKKDPYFQVQKLCSNQIYNPYSKQILLQNSINHELTPKKQLNEQISQYLSDRNINKKLSFQVVDQYSQNQQQNNNQPQGIDIRPLNNIKLEQDFKEKLFIHHHQKNINNHENQQNQNDMRSEQLLIAQNKQEDKLPKRGLTYISKKLSLLLRQKKRIKSSQLFSISLFDDEDQQLQDQKLVASGVKPLTGQKGQVKQQKQGEQLKESKQRRNIRRRIYDSINVMLALGIIKKVKNQFIYIQQKDDITDQSSIIQQQEILVKKKDFLTKLENDCSYKEQCLKYLTQSYSKMKILRKLNSQYEEKLNTLNENTFATNSQAPLPTAAAPEQKIQFPFVLLQNGNNRKLKVQLINEAQQAEQRIKKVNDWTDYIQVQNPNKQREIQMIKIRGQKMRMISDVDCINLLSSMQIDENTDGFEKNQMQILRDYEIINQHRLRKNEQLFAKNFANKFGKE